MISRDEFAIMQRQMVRMNDEKLEMKAQIITLKEANAQQITIRECIARTRAQRNYEEHGLIEEITDLRERINEIKQELGPDRRQTWDEKRLTRKEVKLTEVKEEETAMKNAIIKIQQHLQKLASKGEQYNKAIIEQQRYIAKMNSLHKKAHHYDSIAMQIEDLESTIKCISESSRKVNKKIGMRHLSISNLGISNASLSSDLQKLTDQYEDLFEMMQGGEGDCEAIEEALVEIKSEESQLKQELSEAEAKLRSITDLSTGSSGELIRSYEQLKMRFESLEKDIVYLQGSIDNERVESQIKIRKRIVQTEQLNHTITERIAELTKKRNESPQVQQMIIQQEEEWVEKEEMIQWHSDAVAKHKEVSETVARKSIILDELKKWTKTIEPVGMGDPMSELTRLYGKALQLNRNMANKNILLTQTLDRETYENLSLKRELNKFV